MATTTGLIPNWYPPTRENYETLLTIWTFFPIGASLQWLVSWYGMGKTSAPSRLNLPGRLGWLTMEAPGFLTLLYHVSTLPQQHGIDSLPWQNKVLAALFVMHYTYRALLFPFMQPSIAPLHVVVWAAALAFQLVNGTCLGAWLAAYGPTTQAEWDRQLAPFGVGQFAVGIALFYVGLAANFFHDDELREIRRRETRRQAKLRKEGQQVAAAERHYEIPKAGLFQIMLFPHYFVEWVEWAGFWMAAGWGCVPARCFLVNEVAAMLPRAVNGRKWYVERFGDYLS